MFKVFLILDLYTSSNSWQDVLTNKPAHAHTADFPRYLPLAKDVSPLPEARNVFSEWQVARKVGCMRMRRFVS